MELRKALIEQMEAQIEFHQQSLNRLDKDSAIKFTNNYRQYYVSHHLNEIERLEQEISNLYDN